MQDYRSWLEKINFYLVDSNKIGMLPATELSTFPFSVFLCALCGKGLVCQVVGAW